MDAKVSQRIAKMMENFTAEFTENAEFHFHSSIRILNFFYRNGRQGFAKGAKRLENFT
jgi:hypothetical protein